MRLPDTGSAVRKGLPLPSSRAQPRNECVLGDAQWRLAIAALEDTALLNDLPLPDERFDFVSQLKDALLVMHQHGLLQYEVLHRTR